MYMYPFMAVKETRTPERGRMRRAGCPRRPGGGPVRPLPRVAVSAAATPPVDRAALGVDPGTGPTGGRGRARPRRAQR